MPSKAQAIGTPSALSPLSLHGHKRAAAVQGITSTFWKEETGSSGAHTIPLPFIKRHKLARILHHHREDFYLHLNGQNSINWPPYPH